MNQTKLKNTTALIMTGLIVVLICSGSVLAKDRSDKFLMVHLDGTSAEAFYDQLEKGNLPNTALLMAEGQRVDYGVTVFPSVTPLIVSRLKTGLDNSEGIVAWAYVDPETGRTVNQVEIFLEMISHIDPRSHSQFVFKQPILTELAGISLLNLDRLWETHDFLEFYWIYADSQGHSHGKEAYLKGLQKFDFYLGLAMKSGQLDGANIIFYSDHGLSVDNIEVIRDKKLITQMLGDEIIYMFYPNIFLKNPERNVEYAQRIVTETPVDLGIVKETEATITGYFDQGYFQINHHDGKYQYTFSGQDYFGYSELGYKQEFLAKEEWLQLTMKHKFPGTPVILFDYLKHEYVGDIVIVLNAPKVSWYRPNIKAHHAGLTSSDMRIPILFVGPAFKEVEAPETMWIYDLFSEHLTMVDFDAPKHRERHSLSLSYPFTTELSLSPTYKVRGGITLSQESLSPWLELDLYSSFLTRVWVGGRYHDHKLNWRLNVEGFVGDFKARWLKHSSEPGTLSLHYRLNDHFEVMASTKKQIGVSVFF